MRACNALSGYYDCWTIIDLFFITPAHCTVVHNVKRWSLTSVNFKCEMEYAVHFRWIYWQGFRFDHQVRVDYSQRPHLLFSPNLRWSTTIWWFFKFHRFNSDSNRTSGSSLDLENLEKWEYTWKTWKNHGILKNWINIMEKLYETWKNWVATKHTPDSQIWRPQYTI